MGIAMKKEKKDQKKKYSKLGSLVWAMKKLAQLDARFVLFIFATVPVAVVTPLVKSLFSKTLIDDIGAGKNFKELVITVSIFIGIIFVLDLLQRYIRMTWTAFRIMKRTLRTLRSKSSRSFVIMHGAMPVRATVRWNISGRIFQMH